MKIYFATHNGLFFTTCVSMVALEGQLYGFYNFCLPIALIFRIIEMVSFFLACFPKFKCFSTP